MKKIIIYIVFFFPFIGVYPQFISIELSIEWKKEASLLPGIYMNGNKNRCIPYLNITYRNNGEDSVYFLKVSESYKGIPPIITSTLTSNVDNTNTPQPIPNYSGKDYYVYIINSPDCGKSWEITSDTCILSQEHAEDNINYDLYEIYQLLSKKLMIDSDSIEYWPSKKEDVEESALLNRYKNNFIFLKKGEVFSEQYSLLGFYVLGGNFEFGIHPDHLYDYIEGEPSWSDEQKMWIYKKMNLPKHLNGYKLYSESFLSNTVSLKIKRPR